MKKLFIITLIGFLSGCATPIFTKPGVTEAQLNKDAYECKIQASTASPDNMFIMGDLLKECMSLRGYQKK